MQDHVSCQAHHNQTTIKQAGHKILIERTCCSFDRERKARSEQSTNAQVGQRASGER
jgi:hypothetical protein